MPFGPYGDFNDCVMKNGDKGNPEAFCAWLEHKITGAWPGQLSADKYPEQFWTAYDAALSAKKADKEAYQEAVAAAEAAGYSLTRFGWVKEFQAPNMKTITGVRVFGAGTWTDSAGFERTWSDQDLDNMIAAFAAGVPAVVPLKCGHTSDEFNMRIAEALGVPVENVTGDHGQGQIALGRMVALQRKGSWNIASFDKVPEPIANLIEGGQYSTVSVEIEDEVGEYGPVITGVALLGAEEPAVEGATTERALVFGGTRQGARVWSFKVGDDIPMSELKAEFDDIRGKLAEIVKGKRGAPIFRAMFGNLSELFERLTAGKHAAQDDAEVLAEIRAYAVQEYQGNVQPLIAWAGTVGFDACVVALTGKPGITDPTRVCGWLKGQAHSKSNEGGNDMKLPKALEGKKPEDIRAMSIPDLAKLFAEGETPKVEELKAAFQEGELAAIAAALGLGEEATVEDMVAAITALTEKAAAGEGEGAKPPEGEMGKEFAKANDRILNLEKTLASERSLREWETRTAAFTTIPGTPHEHAVSLADIEGKAGKDAAETQFKALDHANKLAAEATKVVGTARTGGVTDFDNEVKRYMSEHKDATKVQAIEAVSKERPDLYFARREGWDQ